MGLHRPALPGWQKGFGKSGGARMRTQHLLFSTFLSGPSPTCSVSYTVNNQAAISSGTRWQQGISRFAA